MPAPSRKARLREYLVSHQVLAIGEAEWLALIAHLAPVSESYLRQLLRDTGLPFAQPYAGIHQSSFEEVERTLLEMLEVYRAAMAGGDRKRARYCRRQVIAAKDRARHLAALPKTKPEEQARKNEMVQWMLVWLENPEVFPAWVEIRKRNL